MLLPIALALLVAVLLGGCGSGDAESPSPSPTGPITVTDDAGEEVTLAQPPTRVVSLAPTNTEIAFAIGAGDIMVGGTTFDDYPEAAKALPKIGGFSDPNIEKIVELEPDLVIATGGIQAGLREKLEQLGMTVYVLQPLTYAATVDDIRELGRLMGVEDKAEQVAADMEATAAAVAEKVGSLDKPVTFVEIYSQPLMTAGKETFIDDLVTLAGGTNLGATAGSAYPSFSKETLITADPDVYIAVSGAQSTPGNILKRAGYGSLSAVKSDRVYIIEDDLVTRSGPRLAEGLKELAEMIHPEAYREQ